MKVDHRTATQIARFAVNGVVKRKQTGRTQTPVAASDRNIP
jgi:hypothetical protein